MKHLIYFSLTFLTFSAQANLCKSSNQLLQNWRDQVNWQETIITPNVSNGLTYDAVQTNDGKTLLYPFEITSSFKSKIEVSIGDNYSHEEFVDVCKNDIRGGKALTRSRTRGSSNTFRIPVDFFPGSNSHPDLALNHQEFKTVDMGLRLIFEANSIVKRNIPFLSDLTKVRIELEEVINDRLDLSKGDILKNGMIEINLDGMDDLACDLMKGQAQVEFYNFSRMNEPKVQPVTLVDPQDTKTLYEEMKPVVEKQTSPAARVYWSGRIFEKLTQRGETHFDENLPSLELITKMFSKNYLTLNHLSNADLKCLAEDYSTFEKNEVENKIILNVKTQNIFELERKL